MVVTVARMKCAEESATGEHDGLAGWDEFATGAAGPVVVDNDGAGWSGLTADTSGIMMVPSVNEFLGRLGVTAQRPFFCRHRAPPSSAKGRECQKLSMQRFAGRGGWEPDSGLPSRR